MKNSPRFTLRPYRNGGKTECPECHQRTFTPYIDTLGQIQFPAYVGRCDREEKCRYHYPPRQYFQDHPQLQEAQDGLTRPLLTPVTIPQVPLEPSFIDIEIVRKTLGNCHLNPLFQFLSSVVGTDKASKIFQLYRVGTAMLWGGATVFWQIDTNGRARAGKIMAYDPLTGHRIKDQQARVNWVHSVLKLPNFNLRQCLFGEHLLSRFPHKAVMMVESEKSALVGAIMLPDYLWLATGGKNGCFNPRGVEVLRGREVVL